MAVVQPFRAVRYDERKAGPLESLVAPPYDVISSEDRDRLRASSQYNVVHLTLPDDEAEAARLWREWNDAGVLVRDEEPAVWWLSQDYVGPDGVARTRDGLLASVRAEPYESRAVLPHERTHAGPKEGRLRLLRAVGAQLEPIFLLHDGALDLRPDRVPDLEASLDGITSRLWRLEGDVPEFGTLLIADGHHRYETAVAFAAEGGSPNVLAVIVPTEQEGLTIFPTHRVAQSWHNYGGELEPVRTPEEGLERIAAQSRESPAFVLYDRRGAIVVKSSQSELDAAFVERFEPEGVTYTPHWQDAVASVDAGDANVAFLMRAPTIQQVAAVAHAGETMPQKSTYFYPKLLSGLVFHPV